MIYVSSACIQKNKIGEIIEQLAESGIKNIELSGGTEYYCGIEEDLNRMRQMHQLQYACHAYFPPPEKPFVINLASCNDQIYQQSINHYLKCIELLKHLGCRILSIHAGFMVEVGVGEIGHKLNNRIIYDEAKAYERFCSAYEQIAKKCKENGVLLYVENNVLSAENYKEFDYHNYMMMTNYASIMKMKEQIEFNLLLDLGHLYVSANTLGLNYFRECERLRKHVKWLHISENNGIIDEHKPLKENSIILKEYRKMYCPDINVTVETVGSMDKILSSIKLIEEEDGIMNLSKMKCSCHATLKDVMVCIDNNTKGTAFIVDDIDRLIGVVTDGDIRRLLINGYGLNDFIYKHIRKNFVYAFESDMLTDITDRFDDAIKIIPIVDENMHLVDYVCCDKNSHISLAQPQLNGNEYKYLVDAFLSTWISSTGKYIMRFEKEFSKYCGVKYGVATSNGTTALHLALTALGIGNGDEVIVPDLTFAATINAVIYTGATPVIVDIEEDSWCINPKKIEEAITSRTKAIIPVHIYGQPCDMERICDVAQRRNLYIVEDCAEAHGAEWNHKKVGSFGIISCFSFFGNKVITTGEGGMCITDNEELNEKMRILRDHGMSKDRKYYHEVIGFNYRMTNIQAAIGTAQVERIEEILEWREKLEERYREVFKGLSGVTLQTNTFANRKKISWLVSILISEDKRDDVLTSLKTNGIDARPFFTPLSKMEIYQNYARECKTSRMISKKGLNLPTTHEMNLERIEKIKSLIVSELKGE